MSMCRDLDSCRRVGGPLHVNVYGARFVSWCLVPTRRQTFSCETWSLHVALRPSHVRQGMTLDISPQLGQVVGIMPVAYFHSGQPLANRARTDLPATYMENWSKLLCLILFDACLQRLDFSHGSFTYTECTHTHVHARTHTLAYTHARTCKHSQARTVPEIYPCHPHTPKSTSCHNLFPYIVVYAASSQMF